MKSFSITLLIFSCFFLSCTKEKGKMDFLFDYTKNDLNIETNDAHLYIFLPHSACSTCIIKLKEFFKENDNSNISIIFIGRSEKQLNYLSEGYPKQGVYKDPSGIAYDKDILKEYTPALLFLRDGKLNLIEYPQNDIISMVEQIKTFIEKD
jgi:hypothetical protein